MLTAHERERLRQAVDRAARKKIGATRSGESWVTLPEASSIVGLRAQELRARVRALGIETRKSGPRNLIQVSALDRLRD